MITNRWRQTTISIVHHLSMLNYDCYAWAISYTVIAFYMHSTSLKNWYLYTQIAVPNRPYLPAWVANAFHKACNVMASHIVVMGRMKSNYAVSSHTHSYVGIHQTSVRNMFGLMQLFLFIRQRKWNETHLTTELCGVYTLIKCIHVERCTEKDQISPSDIHSQWWSCTLKTKNQSPWFSMFWTCMRNKVSINRIDNNDVSIIWQWNNSTNYCMLSSTAL